MMRCMKTRAARIAAAALLAAALATGQARLYPCSTFQLRDGRTLLVGHNLDERTRFPGAVFVNKRGVEKTSISYLELLTGRAVPGPRLRWTSRYASLTFNAFGRDFPDGGMNEAGLFVGEMSYPPSKFPDDPAKPRMFISLWVQHLLDTCATVDQVAASASQLSLDGWGWHFLAADRSGALAAIEFLDGRVVVHRGADMPVPVLCNEPYEYELRRREDHLGQRSAQEPPAAGEIPRFVQAGEMIEKYGTLSGRAKRPAVAYAFDILAALERGGTQWSFVCDLNKGEAWFKTASTPKIKHVALGRFRKGCAAPVKFLDMDADFAGEAGPLFADYSPAANQAIAERALAAILRISPDFAKVIERMGETQEKLVGRFAAYPLASRCR